MLNISPMCKKIIWFQLAIAFASITVGLILGQPLLPFIKGVAFGTIFSIVKIVLLEKTISKTLSMSPERAVISTRLNFILRYILSGVVLVISATDPSISLIGAVIGIFSLQVSVYISPKFVKIS